MPKGDFGAKTIVQKEEQYNEQVFTIAPSLEETYYLSEVLNKFRRQEVKLKAHGTCEAT